MHYLIPFYDFYHFTKTNKGYHGKHILTHLFHLFTALEKKLLLRPQFKTFSFSILLQNVLDTGRKASACGLKVALLKMLQTILEAGRAQVNIGKVEGKAVGADRAHGGDATPPAAAAGGQDPAGGTEVKGSGGGKWRKISCVRGGRVMQNLMLMLMSSIDTLN